MINLSRVQHHKTRDFTKQCVQNCVLCRTPCDKQGKYASVRPREESPPLPVIPLQPLPA